MDEFYGGYNYTSDCDGTVVSAADNVEDVDEDGKSHEELTAESSLTQSRCSDH
jgi:hypothetical protein